MIAYRIKDWAKHFEKADTRKCKSMLWVPVPTKHDGKGFRRIAQHPEGIIIFAGWILLLQIASKMPVRGLLADEDRALTTEDMEFMTGFSAEVFELALESLTDPAIGWIEKVEPKRSIRMASG